MPVLICSILQGVGLFLAQYHHESKSLHAVSDIEPSDTVWRVLGRRGLSSVWIYLRRKLEYGTNDGRGFQIWCTRDEILGTHGTPPPYNIPISDDLKHLFATDLIYPTLRGTNDGDQWGGAVTGYHGTDNHAYASIMKSRHLNSSRKGMLGAVRHFGSFDKAARFALYPTYYKRGGQTKHDDGGVIRFLIPLRRKRVKVIGSDGFDAPCECYRCKDRELKSRCFVDHNGKWLDKYDVCILPPTSRWLSRGGTKRPEFGIRDDVTIMLLDGFGMDMTFQTEQYDSSAVYPIDAERFGI